MDKTEIFAVVDDDDNVVGEATWDELREKKLTHRTSNVFVFNSKGELYVHKRAAGLSLYPGMYDVKFGGITRAGESYDDCAKRELEEESGIKDVEIEFLFPLKFRQGMNNCNRKVYKTVYDGEFVLQEEEVENGEFMTVDEAKKMMEEGKLSDSAKNVFEEYLRRI
jgi:isopentenyldiphosphate isomerase